MAPTATESMRAGPSGTACLKRNSNPAYMPYIERGVEAGGGQGCHQSQQQMCQNARSPACGTSLARERAIQPSSVSWEQTMASPWAACCLREHGAGTWFLSRHEARQSRARHEPIAWEPVGQEPCTAHAGQSHLPCFQRHSVSLPPPVAPLDHGF